MNRYYIRYATRKGGENGVTVEAENESAAIAVVEYMHDFAALVSCAQCSEGGARE